MAFAHIFCLSRFETLIYRADHAAAFLLALRLHNSFIWRKWQGRMQSIIYAGARWTLSERRKKKKRHAEVEKKRHKILVERGKTCQLHNPRRSENMKCDLWICFRVAIHFVTRLLLLRPAINLFWAALQLFFTGPKICDKKTEERFRVKWKTSLWLFAGEGDLETDGHVHVTWWNLPTNCNSFVYCSRSAFNCSQISWKLLRRLHRWCNCASTGSQNSASCSQQYSQWCFFTFSFYLEPQSRKCILTFIRVLFLFVRVLHFFFAL